MNIEDCICFKIGKMLRRIGKTYKERLSPYGITSSQFFILIALYEEDGITAGELAKKVDVDPSSLTGIVDRLERQGLVERIFKKDDRLAVYL